MLLLSLPPLTALAACSGGDGPGSLGPEREEPVRAVTAEDTATGTRLSVEAGCLDKARLLLDDDSPRAVALRLVVRRWDSNGKPVPACATGSSVTLAAPLGNRAVVDATTGDPVDVSRFP